MIVSCQPSRSSENAYHRERCSDVDPSFSAERRPMQDRSKLADPVLEQFADRSGAIIR
jgi:hypothetical protein